MMETTPSGVGLGVKYLRQQSKGMQMRGSMTNCSIFWQTCDFLYPVCDCDATAAAAQTTAWRALRRAARPPQRLQIEPLLNVIVREETRVKGICELSLCGPPQILTRAVGKSSSLQLVACPPARMAFSAP